MFCYWFQVAYDIDCTSTNCQNSIIDCLPNENCSISCTKISACIGSTINCPINGDCNIECRGGTSCENVIINATQSNGNFDLQCLDSTDHCRNIQVYGSEIPSNTGNFNINCDGYIRSCAYSTINCPVSGDCSISCTTDTSCRYSQINGPSINGELTINCNGDKSCFDAIFDGRNTNTLQINGCQSYDSCLDLTLYCPPNSNGSKNCFIQGLSPIH